MASIRLHPEVREQMEGLRARRVRQGVDPADLGSDPDVVRLQRALEQADQIAEQLGVDDVVDRLSWEQGAKLTLRVSLAPWSPLRRTLGANTAVLKIDGSFDRDGAFEGDVLTAQREVEPTIPLVGDEGLIEASDGSTTHFIVMEDLGGRQLSGFAHEPPLADAESARIAAAGITQKLRNLHSARMPDNPNIKQVADEIRKQYEEAVKLVAVGPLGNIARRVDVFKLANALAEGEAHVLLHGDVAGENTVVVESGELIPIDPPGSVGPREFDSARMVARFTTSARLNAQDRRQLSEAATSGYPGLDGIRYQGYLLLETITELAWNTPRLGVENARELLSESVARCLEHGLPGITPESGALARG